MPIGTSNDTAQIIPKGISVDYVVRVTLDDASTYRLRATKDEDGVLRLRGTFSREALGIKSDS